MHRIRIRGVAAVALSLLFAGAVSAEQRQLFWGDTHLHTKYSPDAFLNGNFSIGPDEAYRFAKGQPVLHPLHRSWVQLEQPLDFLVVSDHAELMGVMHGLYMEQDYGEVDLPTKVLRKLGHWYLRKLIADGDAVREFNHNLPHASEASGNPVANPANTDGPQAMMARIDESAGDIISNVWKQITDSADAHYEPGVFTSFVGWEWSSMPLGANLHRVVLSPSDAAAAQQYLPYSSSDSQYPEDLWAWLDATTARTGAQFLTIPHNSNLSRGYMFADSTLKGGAITAEYARQRARYEPVVEITQIKGDSETWPALSPDDPFAEFEPFPYYLQGGEPDEYIARPADYVRQSLVTGMQIGQRVGVNPFKFGVIGSTDAHTGLSTPDSDNFQGKMAFDSIPENKASTEAFAANGWGMSASGLAAVWAEENTREAIFDAFRRREVYATTGPRIALRVFAGFDLPEDLADDGDFERKGYRLGVPMGGDLFRQSGDPPVALAVRALRDPRGANLDQLNIIKGWVDSEGNAREKVYAVAWSDDRPLGAEGFPDSVGNTVDLQTARYDNSIGADELTAVWTDPDFQPDQRAFYYVRVIQIPTARHSLYDTLALGLAHAADAGPSTIQERAYSSPIWYNPGPR